MRKLSILGLAAGVASALLLVGGMFVTKYASADTPSSTTSSADQINGSWVLVKWSDAGEVPEGLITMNIEGSSVNGESACNNYFGPITIDGSKFEAKDMAMTLMFCMDTADAETTYHKLLTSVEAWSMDGDALVLADSSGEVLRFERA